MCLGNLVWVGWRGVAVLQARAAGPAGAVRPAIAMAANNARVAVSSARQTLIHLALLRRVTAFLSRALWRERPHVAQTGQ